MSSRRSPDLLARALTTRAPLRREDAQRTRIAAQEHFASLPATMPMLQRARELNDLLVILLHTVTPPDRVGVVSSPANERTCISLGC